MTVRIVTANGRPLTQRAKAFAHEYAQGTNAKHSAIAAGYSPKTASHRASMLLRQSRVWEIIDNEREAMRRLAEAEPKIDRKAIRAEARAAIEAMLHPRKKKP